MIQVALMLLPATPNAVGMAYFLIEHKRELGSMFIDYVSIFQCDNDYRSLCAMFEISPDPLGSLVRGSLDDVSRILPSSHTRMRQKIRRTEPMIPKSGPLLDVSSYG